MQRIFLNTMLCGGSVAVSMLLLVSCAQESSVTEPLYERELEGEVFDITPVRGAVEPLVFQRGSFTYKCTECHNDFSSPRRQDELRGEHADIDARFDHGMNIYCVNCHHQEDRNAYVDHDGSPIPSSEPARLCAKCHGPTYRDWQNGVHGRQNGSWKRGSQGRSKLLCIQCHDPHLPQFAPMEPDPPTIATRFDDDVTTHETEAPHDSMEPGRETGE